MALYFYFNETTGDMVYSDQATYDVDGYTSLGQQTNISPTLSTDWIFSSKRTNIKTVTKDPNISAQIDILNKMSYMFSDCSVLTFLDLDGFDTSNVTDISYMFNNCSALASLDLSGFDTSNMKNMSYMFSDCSVLTSLNLGNFDTSNVTDMSCMFYGCIVLTSLDLGGFDTSNVTSMDNMFDECAALRIIDIGPNMSNALSKLPADTYYDAVTRQPYAKADISGDGTYVRDLEDLDLVATMVQTRMGINVAKHLAHKAFEKANAGVLDGPGIKQWLLDNVYRVGYVWISYVDESPADLIGGTWTPITGVFPYFNTDTSTGGSNSVTLTVAQMPSHDHPSDWQAFNGYMVHSHVQSGPQATTASNPYWYVEERGKIAPQGGDQAFNNMPSYQSLYAWRRTE